MSSLPFGIYFTIVETRGFSLSKLAIFASTLFFAGLFWGGLGWLVLSMF